MTQLFLIGSGNIGRRHLQGLLHSATAYEIFIVDTVPHCLDLAKQAIDEVATENKSLHTFHFLTNINQLPVACDVAIVATNADVRKKVVENLLQHCTPRYLILEKVLFQKEEDYRTIGKLLYQKNIPTYVNCTRRYYGHYQKIKNVLLHEQTNILLNEGLGNITGKLNYRMTVTGSSWGLACNTIHLLDLFNYFTDHTDYSFTDSKIDNEIVASKRAGFIELTGTIESADYNSFYFSATSSAELGQPVIVEIELNETKFVINETAGTCISSLSFGEGRGEVNYEAIPLSKASHLFVNDLLQTGKCKLTDFFVSAQLHLCLLKTYRTFLEKNNVELKNGVPIT